MNHPASRFRMEAVKKTRILLADSHKIMLQGLRGLLGSSCEIVAEVEDGPMLFEASGKLKPDIVVMDHSLSEFDGVAALRRLKERNADLKIIVLSVYDEPTVMREVLAAGASGFVLKRSAVSNLIPAIEEVRRGAIYISPDAYRDHE